MIKSMTGYGRGESTGKYSWVVEIRSVNHRFLDIFVRLPKPWLLLEDKIKNYIKGKISRGRIDVFTSLTAENVPVDIKLDKRLVNNYYQRLVELKSEVGFEGPISLDLLSLIPDIFIIEEDIPIEDELWDSLVIALDEALKNLIIMRMKEGGNLWGDLHSRLVIIKNNIQLIKKRAEVVPEEYSKKLKNSIDKLCNDVILDNDRIETEIVLFAEKSNITEELVRLSSHIDQMEGLADSDESVGKKMDFIAQEMLREANTIAAKSSDYDISKGIIEIKSELEKIREQIQNIE